MNNQKQIAEIINNRRSYISFLKGLAAKFKYVVFYGCGNIFSSTSVCWKQHIGRIDFICDSDPGKWGKEFFGIKCISPDELAAIQSDSAVFISSGAIIEIAGMLDKLGIKNYFPIYKTDIFSEVLLKQIDVADCRHKFAEVYSLCEDEKSRQILLTMLQRSFHNFQDISLMSSVCDKDQYFFRDILTFSDHESFADVGAYNGDTIQEFISVVNGKFENIYAFELCKDNFDILLANCAKIPDTARINCYNVGCWDSCQEVKYNVESSSSTIGKGEVCGTVDRMDKILAGKTVTFIKMDIEGAELNALRGAENIIRTRKPKMAICVYHDLRHFYEVPLYLKSLVPEYKIYFRHHTALEYETVCYATV